MNAEIAKERIVLSAYGSLLNEVTDNEMEVDEMLGAEYWRRLTKHADLLEDGEDAYSESSIVFIRQQVRESAARLLALIEADYAETPEEGAQPDEVTTEYDETAAE
jgi:hypothetical protein